VADALAWMFIILVGGGMIVGIIGLLMPVILFCIGFFGMIGLIGLFGHLLFG
jgi:hypothetical protein